jgi:HSP20 family molecular chaperone IbpA
MSVFSSPFLLGFDELEQLMDRTARKAGDGFPPYNIEQFPASENAPLRIVITLAVAGFSPDDLDVTLENKQLLITGKQTETGGNEYLHRGIAARQFQRAFVLADGMEVTGAGLENGLLSIELEQPQPKPVVKRIEINSR